jgi:hypothetical protein
VRVFEVDTLTRTAYAEHEVPDSPILTPPANGWNNVGMHQCDEWWNGQYWLAAVDGRDSVDWAIGIYFRSGYPVGATSLSEFAPPLRVYPNPVRAGDAVHVLTRQSQGSPRSGLEIFDAAGRIVYRSRTGSTDDNSAPFVWNGRDAAGHDLAPGVYFVKARSDGRGSRDQTKITVTR